MAKTIFVLFLFQLSYYLGSYQTTKPFTPDPSSSPAAACSPFNLTAAAAADQLDFRPLHAAAAAISLPSDAAALLPPCPSNFTDYCPCHDPAREGRFDTRRFFHRERHCPGEAEKVRCLVPRPAGYRTPPRWPASKAAAWFANVPSKRLVEEKKNQNWVRLEGEQLVFPGGGTSFPKGAADYIKNMARIVPIKGGVVRTALDTGCGVSGLFHVLAP